jgi:hypothetical protein
METAKVDIRKLQLLNDRINQCIDALAQVRLSVHGLSAGFGPALSGFQGQPQFAGFQGPQGIQNYLGQQQGIPGYFGQQPPLSGFPVQGLGFAGVPPFGLSPFVQPQLAQQAFGAGLSHSGGLGAGFGIPPVSAQIPWANAQSQGLGGLPWLNPMLGLSHTSPEEYTRSPLSDPILASRIGLTFPYAHHFFPPSVSAY